ncbi:MAG: OadG family protein [Fimbriimonadaceae bacterium]
MSGDLGQSLLIMVVGMLTVFVALVLTAGMILALGWMFKSGKTKLPEPAKDSSIPVLPEHMPVIAATVAALLGSDPRIRDISPLSAEDEDVMAITAAIAAAYGPEARIRAITGLSDEEGDAMAIAAAVAATYGANALVRSMRPLSEDEDLVAISASLTALYGDRVRLVSARRIGRRSSVAVRSRWGDTGRRASLAGRNFRSRAKEFPR